MIIVNDKGRAFFVRVVFEGESYGRANTLTHNHGPDPLIEFFDYTYANVSTFGPRGQPVGSYYASTLASTAPGAGLCLDGGTAEWNIDGEAFAPVIETAKRIQKPRKREVKS